MQSASAAPKQQRAAPWRTIHKNKNNNNNNNSKNNNNKNNNNNNNTYNTDAAIFSGAIV